eukprot:gene14557-biopygen23124
MRCARTRQLQYSNESGKILGFCPKVLQYVSSGQLFCPTSLQLRQKRARPSASAFPGTSRGRLRRGARREPSPTLFCSHCWAAAHSVEMRRLGTARTLNETPECDLPPAGMDL